MTAKIFPAFALAAFVLTSCTQPDTDVRRAEQSSASVQQTVGLANASAETGRALFLKNCAHCHGADARGDEGPDLHNLDWTHEQIANRIRNGKKGQMTAFAGKLSQSQIDLLVTYVRTLK